MELKKIITIGVVVIITALVINLDKVDRIIQTIQ